MPDAGERITSADRAGVDDDVPSFCPFCWCTAGSDFTAVRDVQHSNVPPDV